MGRDAPFEVRTSCPLWRSPSRSCELFISLAYFLFQRREYTRRELWMKVTIAFEISNQKVNRIVVAPDNS